MRKSITIASVVLATLFCASLAFGYNGDYYYNDGTNVDSHQPVTLTIPRILVLDLQEFNLNFTAAAPAEGDAHWSVWPKYLHNTNSPADAYIYWWTNAYSGCHVYVKADGDWTGDGNTVPCSQMLVSPTASGWSTDGNAPNDPSGNWTWMGKTNPGYELGSNGGPGGGSFGIFRLEPGRSCWR